MIKFVNYRLHKFFDLAVRCDETIVDSKIPTTNSNEDIEDEPKLLGQRAAIDVPSAETQ